MQRRSGVSAEEGIFLEYLAVDFTQTIVHRRDGVRSRRRQSRQKASIADGTTQVVRGEGVNLRKV